MNLHAGLTTQRLRLRRPVPADAQAIFDSFASDAEVTRYLGWKQHDTLADTKVFIEFSDVEWQDWQCGPLIIELPPGNQIIGGSGLHFETPYRASTGYVLAQRAWGKGYATEALAALMKFAQSSGLWRVEAICHHAHARSAKVLEKCGFLQEGVLRRHSLFPNLDPVTPQDVLMYARILR